jgi:hypothetical protein
LVFGKLPGKIRLLELISSNSENISCVTFLKHKNRMLSKTLFMAPLPHPRSLSLSVIHGT